LVADDIAHGELSYEEDKPCPLVFKELGIMTPPGYGPYDEERDVGTAMDSDEVLLLQSGSNEEVSAAFQGGMSASVRPSEKESLENAPTLVGTWDVSLCGPEVVCETYGRFCLNVGSSSNN